MLVANLKLLKWALCKGHVGKHLKTTINNIEPEYEHNTNSGYKHHGKHQTSLCYVFNEAEMAKKEKELKAEL